MCAIVDANTRDEVFGDTASEAGRFFFEWLTNGRGKLVVGGRLLSELGQSNNFNVWLGTALRVGRARRIPDDVVNAREQELRRQGAHRSDDPHVLALALVSRARLLFTNDHDLQDDFGNASIINNPRGSIYTTRVHKAVVDVHKDLLARNDWCTTE